MQIRQTANIIASRDITHMSRLLELAQGDQESVSEESDDNLPDAHFQDPNTSNQNEDFPVDSFVTSQEIVAKNVTRRNVSPIGKVSRRSWTNEEKEAINKHFKVNITCRKNTSLNECQQAILTSPELSKRTPPQIKSYVNNQIKKCHSRKVNRKGWSADENKMMRNIFAENLEERTLPSLIDCRVVLKQYPMLNDRSDKMIKAWVYNELNRMKKKSIPQ